MNNITSPRIDDQGIEHLIQAKGKKAPRVTPANVEDSVVACYFFTAADGVKGEETRCNRPTCQIEPALNVLTFCVLVLRNGFTVTGESACASVENFDEEIGKNVAKGNAMNKIWPLLGYALKESLM